MTEIRKVIDSATTIFWFRRDLRLDDNAGLYFALKHSKKVLPIFIFDKVILDKLENKRDARVDFIYESIVRLKRQCETHGSSLCIMYGEPAELFKFLEPHSVYANHDYEPYARERDENVRATLLARSIPFHTFKDHVIFEKDEVANGSHQPYTVFTPYSKKWRSQLRPSVCRGYPVKRFLMNLARTRPLPMPTLGEIGFEKSGVGFPARRVNQRVIERYAELRNFPGQRGTSRLSVHLRFGTLSIRRLVQIALRKSDTWLNELIWRDFFHMILWHFPRVQNQPFKVRYENITWDNNEHHFKAWCEGRTGYPIVDAGMRELNRTGFMHNRVRMIAASFLTKNLLIDWRWGEAYFARQLLDFDLAANNGGWQWAAGCGCDAAPYFRIFNPTRQAEKFDPDMKYIRKWIPEVETPAYVRQIVDTGSSRERFMRAYRSAQLHPWDR